ncbi:hypothetical protein ACWEJ6_51480 [Nonomuraea sp. NPDC004702]
MCNWPLVRDQSLTARESNDQALEQVVLDFIHAHGRTNSDAAESWQVYGFVFSLELLPVAGLKGISPAEPRMPREVVTLMALNKVADAGTIANVGPCWLFPAATSVIFDLDEATGGMLDEACDSTLLTTSRAGWSRSRRTPRSVAGWSHGCQSVPDQSGGAVPRSGASVEAFGQDLRAFRQEWLSAA